MGAGVPTDASAQRLRIGAELRRLREVAQLSGEHVASTLGWSQSKVSRIEAGRTASRSSGVTTWCSPPPAADRCATQTSGRGSSRRRRSRLAYPASPRTICGTRRPVSRSRPAQTSKAVQRMLGHASAAMTLDVCAGLFGDDLDAVATRLDEAFAARDADYLRTGTADRAVIDLGKRRSPGR